MSEVASAFVSLAPSARGFGKQLDRQVSGQVTGVGKKLGLGLGRAMFGTVLAVGAAVGVGHLVHDAFDEARESQKVSALTNQVIKSTGGVAKVTAKHVGSLANAISKKVGIDDEAIQSGSNLLLTFKNVRNEVGKGNQIFDRATRAAVNLSAAGFGDITGASKQLGKALNDPVKGITALTRSGVTFTDQQKKQIKTLVASGRTLEAQKIILKEVESQVGGAAAATATAGDKAKVALLNLKESLGTALLPVADKVETFFTNKLAPALTGFVNGIGPAATSVQDFFTAGAGAPAFASAMRVIHSSGDGLQTAFEGAARAFDRIKGDAKTLDLSKIDTKQLGLALSQTLVQGVKGLGKFSGKLLDFFKKIDWVGLGIKVGTFALPFVLGLATGIINGVGDPALWKGIWQHLPDILFAALAIAFLPSKVIGPIGRILTKIPFVGRFLAAALKWVNDLGGPLRKFAGDLFGTFAKAFKGELPFAGLLGKVMSGFRGIGTAVGRFLETLKVQIGVRALDAFAALGRGAGKAVNGLVRLVTFIPRKILKALGNPGTILLNAGKELIGGLIKGILSKLDDLGGAMKKVGSKIKGFLPGSPVREGPLTSWNDGGAGKRLVGLLADGLADTSPLDGAMTRIASKINTHGLAIDHSNVAAAGSGLAGRHLRLVVDGHEFSAYVDDRSDSRVGAHSATDGMTRRAR